MARRLDKQLNRDLIFQGFYLVKGWARSRRYGGARNYEATGCEFFHRVALLPCVEGCIFTHSGM